MQSTDSEKPWLLPRNDVVFKTLFGNHPNVLRKFLQCVLDLPAEVLANIKLLNTNQRIDPDTKLTILDLKVEVKSGDLINIEMQLLPMKSLIKRILYYLSQMLVEQLQPGQKYTELKRVIGILIVDYVMFPARSSPHNSFNFIEKTRKFELSDLMELNILELPKAREIAVPQKPLDVWLKFLAASNEDEFMECASMNEGVNEACAILKTLSADEKFRIEAQNREKAWRDEMDRLEGAREDGIIKGRNGLIISMLNNGISPEQTATIANMSVDEVLAIKASNYSN